MSDTPQSDAAENQVPPPVEGDEVAATHEETESKNTEASSPQVVEEPAPVSEDEDLYDGVDEDDEGDTEPVEFEVPETRAEEHEPDTYEEEDVPEDAEPDYEAEERPE